MATSQESANSCLSPNVYQVMCQLALSDEKVEGILEDHCLNMEVLTHELTEPVPVEKEDASYYKTCVRSLAAVLNSVNEHYGRISVEEFETLSTRYATWTSSPEVLRRCFQLTLAGGVGSLVSVLMCSTVLERSLGDLYLLKGKQCPSMLKDLLLTAELLAFFGQTPIHVLRVLIGPPISINLRNVTWHGFPQASEVHTQYSFMLLCLLLSLGRILLESGVQGKHIKHRKFITFQQLERFKSTGIQAISSSDIPQLEQIIKNTLFIQPAMTEIWLWALEAYRDKRFGESACLLLPQLEHGVRRLFADANNCPQRVLTAESTVLFTTFDEILSPTLEDGSGNKLCEIIGDNLLTLLLDLLVYPDGPRLRDRISHGETDIYHMTHHVTSVILTLCSICAAKYLPDDCAIKQGDLARRLFTFIQAYQSVYHPISIVKYQIKQCAKSLSIWQSIHCPPKDEIESQIDWPLDVSAVYRSETDLGQLVLRRYSTYIPWVIDFRILHPSIDLADDYDIFLNHEIPTLYRNQQIKQKTCEEEVIGLLDRITEKCHLVADQVINVAEERYEQYVNKELRSRQRKTYARLIDGLPLLSSGLRLIVLICLLEIYSLDRLTELSDKQQLSLIRLLKTTLQCCENLLTYTHASKNRWDEAGELMRQLMASYKADYS